LFPKLTVVLVEMVVVFLASAARERKALRCLGPFELPAPQPAVLAVVRAANVVILLVVVILVVVVLVRV